MPKVEIRCEGKGSPCVDIPDELLEEVADVVEEEFGVDKDDRPLDEFIVEAIGRYLEQEVRLMRKLRARRRMARELPDSPAPKLRGGDHETR